MAKIIELPKLSPTMEEGTLVRWFKEEGDPVAVDDLLAEVETDKATMEFRSFDKGTLLKKLVSEGTVTRLGQPVAIFGAPDEDIAEVMASVGGDKAPANTDAKTKAPKKGDDEAPKEGDAKAPKKAPKKASQGDDDQAPEEGPEGADDKDTVPPPARSPAGTPAPSAVAGEHGVAGVILAPSSPRVRRLARERDLDLSGLRGSGARGRVTEDDLDAPEASRASEGDDDRAAARAAALAVAVRPGDSVSDPSSMRKVIARRLTEAKRTVPHFYLEADLDVAALAALRTSLNAVADSPEAKVSFNDLLVRASALALRAVPESNASWIDGKLVRYGRVDISVAVAIDDGLMTPVVRDADKLSVGQIARTIKELAGRAKTRKLKPEEMQGGTFSVSNLGMFGIDRFAAVINPPEGMILAVGSVRDVPVVKDGAVVAGKRCAVTLSCDHRVVDGALGARFLQALRALVEEPLRILA